MVQSVHLWWDLCLRSKSITPRETPLSVPGIKRGQLSDPKVDTFDHWPVRAGHWVDTGSVRMSSLYSLPINDRCKILPVQLDTNGLQQQRSVDVLLVGLVESHFEGCWSCPRCIKFLFLVFVVERQTHPMWWLGKGKVIIIVQLHVFWFFTEACLHLACLHLGPLGTKTILFKAVRETEKKKFSGIMSHLMLND